MDRKTAESNGHGKQTLADPGRMSQLLPTPAFEAHPRESEEFLRCCKQGVRRRERFRQGCVLVFISICGIGILVEVINAARIVIGTWRN